MGSNGAGAGLAQKGEDTVTDIQQPSLAEEEWDLVEAITERQQPKAKLSVYLNEVASARKDALLKRQAKLKAGEELDAVERELEQVEEEIQASKYIIYLTGLPSRMREDIASKAMHEVPLKLDMLGRDDPLNALKRKQRENLLSWVAHIEDVERNGKHRRNWTEEQMEAFMDSLPTAVQNAIDNTIKELTTSSERFTADSASPDF